MVSVNEELTFFKRLQVVGALHAILAFILFVLEGFFGILIIEWWVKANTLNIIVTIFFWIVAPKFIEIFRLKV